jgi:hypothetical protein
MTAIRSAIGEKNALGAMKSNEELINQAYKKAINEHLPEYAKKIIHKNYEDEKRHLSYTEQALKK